MRLDFHERENRVHYCLTNPCHINLIRMNPHGNPGISRSRRRVQRDGNLFSVAHVHGSCEQDNSEEMYLFSRDHCTSILVFL